MAWPLFPICTSYGFTKRADYSVAVVERASGIRSVNRNWYYPLHAFVAVPIDGRQEVDMSKVVRFWHAIGGQSGQFRFKDAMDFTSPADPSDAITAIDQPMVQTQDDPDVWQLVKIYEDEDFLFQQQRLIQKPVSGTIVIANSGTPLSSPADYTIDYETGLVTFSGSVTEPTWGGQFHVPVMFESTPEFMLSSYKFQQTSFALRELRLAAPNLVVAT